MDKTSPPLFFDIDYLDNNQQFQTTEVKAHNHIEAASEFRAVYSGLYLEITGMRQRIDPHVATVAEPTEEVKQD